MDQLLNFLLTAILLYGYPIILGSILIAYIGLPVPLNVLVLAAGAFTTTETLNIYILLPLVAITAFIGDLIGYYLGKRFGYLIIYKYTSETGFSSKQLKALNHFFSNWGGVCVFITRWLATPLGIPINLIAGFQAYSFKSFIIWAAIGEFIWASIYIFLGRMFGDNWIMISEYIEDTPTITTLILVGLICLWIGFKLWQKKLKD